MHRRDGAAPDARPRRPDDGVDDSERGDMTGVRVVLPLVVSISAACPSVARSVFP
ncbi:MULTISPECIES: hypothetical protein [unclassified Blastococcus]